MPSKLSSVSCTTVISSSAEGDTWMPAGAHGSSFIISLKLTGREATQAVQSTDRSRVNLMLTFTQPNFLDREMSST
jgi:hypothetical protein